MDIEAFRNYCIGKKGVSEEFPFDQQTLVFKVCGKMFALTNIDFFESVNLKCDPEEAVLLREQYPSVRPGYHMNKTHWNTLLIDGSLNDQFIKKWTDHSYDLVVAKLTKAQRESLHSL